MSRNVNISCTLYLYIRVSESLVNDLRIKLLDMTCSLQIEK